MSFLSFLSKAQVEEVKTRRGGGGGGSRKPWNPIATLLAIRVWKDGSIFPSEAAVKRFNLEYPAVTITKGELWPYTEAYLAKHAAEQALLPEADRKELPVRYKPSLYEPIGGVPGNGFDVIDSRVWSGFKGEGAMLFISPVAKDQVKVDLFGNTKYDETGKPMVSVLEQGSKTYGPQMLASLKEVYGIELTDEKPYTDLLIIDEITVDGNTVDINKQFSLPVTLVPKIVKRGDDAGKPDYERRDNAIIWGLLPASMILSEEQLAQEDVEEVAAVAKDDTSNDVTANVANTEAVAQ